MTVETFDATTTWVCPDGVTSVSVSGFGGGQSGYPGSIGSGGAGGKGADYSTTALIVVTPGDTYDIVVGIGGTGSPGASGGDTYFDLGVDFKARGGNSGSSSVGTSVYTGGLGGSGWSAFNGGGGGGGSSAGSSQNGQNGSNGTSSSGGSGGVAPSGGGDGGDGGFGAATGESGSIPGGGGGGGKSPTGSANVGGRGQLTLTYSAALPELAPPPHVSSYIPAERTFAPILGRAVATPCGNPVEILIGFDHKRRNGNPIVFRNTLGTWPDLGHPATRVTMYLQTRAAPIPVEGQVDIPVGNGAQVSFEVPSEITAQQIRTHNLGLYVKATMPDDTYFPLVLAGLRYCDPLEHDLQVSFGGDVEDRELLIGCDYKLANGNALVFTNSTGSWPSLVGATAVLVLQGDGEPEEVVGTVDVPFGPDAQVHFDVPKSLTIAHVPQRMTADGVPCRCYVKALLATGDVFPLGAGDLRWRGMMEPD